MNLLRAFAPALFACLAAAPAAETLELEIQAGEHSYRARQELGETFESHGSGALPGGRPPGEYQAIRCDGPWGPLKYRVTLASGPGYRLRARGERLLLQILEHSVISEDRAIAAMSVHCVDTEPRQVVKSLVEIELERGGPAAQRVQLVNGYVLEYRYTP